MGHSVCVYVCLTAYIRYRHAPDDSYHRGRLPHGVVLPVVDAPLHRPEAIDGDGDQCKDGRESHSIVKEDPESADDL